MVYTITQDNGNAIRSPAGGNRLVSCEVRLSSCEEFKWKEKYLVVFDNAFIIRYCSVANRYRWPMQRAPAGSNQRFMEYGQGRPED